jgi:hypothetical protein
MLLFLAKNRPASRKSAGRKAENRLSLSFHQLISLSLLSFNSSLQQFQLFDKTHTSELDGTCSPFN